MYFFPCKGDLFRKSNYCKLKPHRLLLSCMTAIGRTCHKSGLVWLAKPVLPVQWSAYNWIYTPILMGHSFFPKSSAGLLKGKALIRYVKVYLMIYHNKISWVFWYLVIIKYYVYVTNFGFKKFSLTIIIQSIIHWKILSVT